ncbi:hypothetical protein [Proteiniborus sp. MB09-C3]|uniref:hypothetical protein n=1 Tax=Proteiniborus sp. MB09-C3 TaxID=3050072 RepID=UPI0025543A7B|nr:hypothetical protein [Proteiniborus sp. MB09-C3]WIV13192.1 hypothetical protein QO263_05645 [Proteiniborus sp. MB09-C3]
MTKEERTIECAISYMVNNQSKQFSKELVLCAEILKQIKEKGTVYDYTKFSMTDQELVSDIAYNIYKLEQDVDNNKWVEPEDLFCSDEEIGELYTGDEEDEPELDFEDIGDFMPVTTDELYNLYSVLSGIGVPNIIFDGIGYCFNNGYYKIKDVGIEKMVLAVTQVEKSELDPMCIKLLENQM